MLSLNITSIQQTAASLVGQYNPSGPSLAVPFTYPATGGQQRIGTRSTLRKEVVNSDAGVNTDYQFSLICPLAQFGTVLPTGKQRVSVAGVTYLIIATETDAVGATIKLHLGSEYDR